MTQAAPQRIVEPDVPLMSVFSAFLMIALCGVGGGGLVWARRILVEPAAGSARRSSPISSPFASACLGRTSSASPSALGRRRAG